MRRSRILIGMSLAFCMAPAVFAAAPTCTTGELVAGSPDYSDPADRAKNGQDLLDVPPLGFRQLLFVGDKMVTATGAELWVSDLSAATPVLKRFAGRESQSGHQSLPGKCIDARFSSVSALALMPDGSLAGTDPTANNVFVVSDPFGPNCSVAYLAGATKPQPSLNPGYPDAAGDADGPGTGALLSGPEWLAAATDGTIYFIDGGVGKLKKIAPDAAHTVTTVTKVHEGAHYAMLLLKGKIYTIGNNESAEGILAEIDPATGETRDVLRGRSDIWQSDGAINISGLATDGTGFFTTQSGQLLYVTLDGDVENIAGNGTYFELQADYDPHQPHPAEELEFWSSRQVQTAGANNFLNYRDGHIYFSAKGNTAYVERIACK